MIVRVAGEHNHDNSLLESAVKKIVKDKTEEAANNKNILPRTLRLFSINQNADTATAQGQGIKYPFLVYISADMISKNKKNVPLFLKIVDRA